MKGISLDPVALEKQWEKQVAVIIRYFVCSLTMRKQNLLQSSWVLLAFKSSLFVSQKKLLLLPLQKDY